MQLQLHFLFKRVQSSHVRECLLFRTFVASFHSSQEIVRTVDTKESVLASFIQKNASALFHFLCTLGVFALLIKKSELLHSSSYSI